MGVTTHLDIYVDVMGDRDTRDHFEAFKHEVYDEKRDGGLGNKWIWNRAEQAYHKEVSDGGQGMDEEATEKWIQGADYRAELMAALEKVAASQARGDERDEEDQGDGEEARRRR